MEHSSPNQGRGDSMSLLADTCFSKPPPHPAVSIKKIWIIFGISSVKLVDKVFPTSLPSHVQDRTHTELSRVWGRKHRLTAPTTVDEWATADKLRTSARNVGLQDAVEG
ncbi:hypothetical protein SISNIDRAFT_494529 [Sistotremastrum niveocremeum HHB9708]|uniref:Uncharacterized protein n=1 Tax=Sistotremastrum niveocremeum HHB9708 TaxID=1314777 RepID=A0A164WK76_9AGAM|nr:hypothetical protein SISNIDRAFT_494529 [Sistotremastrum niveocremeum HHB9708]